MNFITRHNVLALSFSVLFCTSLLAQKKVFSGFYIALQGDTVKGIFPGYTQWSRNPSQVEFVTDAQRRQDVLTPQNCRLFVIEGYDEYQPYAGQRLVNPIDDAEAMNEKFPNRLDTFGKTETFLRVVTKTSGCELYVLNDGKRTNFFYKLPGQPMMELKYKKTYEQNQITEVAEYKQQMHNLFVNSIEQQDLAASLEKLPYREEELSSFFKALFPTQKPKTVRHSQGAGWVLSIGASLNTVTIGASKSFTAVATKYGGSVSPLLSVGYLLFIDRSFGKYFFYPQLRLFRYKNTGEVNDGTFIQSTTYQTDLVASADLNGGINVVNKEAVRIYVTGGVGMMGQLNGTQTQQLYAASTHLPYGGKVQTKLPALTYSINASAGLVLNKKFLLSATYMIPSLIGNFAEYTPKLSGVQLRLGYLLE